MSTFTACPKCEDGWVWDGWQDLRLVSASTMEFIRKHGSRKRCQCWNNYLAQRKQATV